MSEAASELFPLFRVMPWWRICEETMAVAFKRHSGTFTSAHEMSQPHHTSATSIGFNHHMNQPDAAIGRSVAIS